MTRWKLTIEYDGTHFSGWQKQAKDLSVQQVLEEAITKFSGETVRLHVAGRTDAGVHAIGQVAHFDLIKEASGDKIRDALNFYARPHLVCILNAEPVPDTFHARFKALGRAYRYVILNRKAPTALMINQAWHIERPLDADAMHNAAQLLLGEHDFTTFRAKNCQAKSPIKTLDQIAVHREGEQIIMTIGARSFLYHQVRNIIGSLVWVGSGKWTQTDFLEAFQACDRARGGPTAPPQGLCFISVAY